MLFLPLKRGVDLKKFVENYEEDVHYCSGEVMDVYYNADELNENAHKTLIAPLGMKSSVELPALALWESYPQESVYCPLSGLSEGEIYKVIEHLCNMIKEDRDISLADLGRRTVQYKENLELKKNPTPVHQTIMNISSNSGQLNLVEGNNNRIGQTVSAMNYSAVQWQQFIDALLQNGIRQKEQGEQIVDLLMQIKQSVEDKDESASQDKVSEVRKILKRAQGNILQGLNLAGSLTSIASIFL